MAELHGRILRFPYRYWLAFAAFGLTLVLATQVRADEAPTIDDLLRAAEDLRADDAAERERAVQYLSTLPESALPAIAERLRQTRRQEIPEEDGYDALRFFRHATGSLRADDMIDIVPGILPTLAERQSTVVGRTAERLLYMRSLEAIGTTESQVMIGDILALTSRMWRWERRRLVERHGASLLPGLLILRNHPESPVRVWARWAIEELGMELPAEALQQDDPMLVARILRAYGESRDMDSMEVVISFVGHPAAPIREAARWSMEQFAHNGIWQLRKAMRNQLGRDADHSWGWEHTARELYEGLDEARLAPLEAVLDEGLAAAESGDVPTATAKLDEVLRAAPMHPRRPAIAEAYLALAEADPASAERFVRRAALLAPDAPEVRAAVLALEADADLGRGVLDADAWREAARHGHPRAREVVEDLLDEELPEVPGEETVAEEGEGVPGWIWLGLAALLALALGYRFRQQLRSAGGSLARRAVAHRWRPRHEAHDDDEDEEPEPLREPAEPSAWREKLTALAAPILDRAHRGLTSTGLLRRLALFRRLVQGKKPTPPPRPKVRAKDVVRERYGKKPEKRAKAKKPARPVVPKFEPRIVDATRPKPPPSESGEETTGLDALLLGAPARPVDADATFRAPPPSFESDARPQSAGLDALVLGANDDRGERSSPGMIEAPAIDPLDAGDTLAEDAPLLGDPNDTLRE